MACLDADWLGVGGEEGRPWVGTYVVLAEADGHFCSLGESFWLLPGGNVGGKCGAWRTTGNCQGGRMKQGGLAVTVVSPRQETFGPVSLHQKRSGRVGWA